MKIYILLLTLIGFVNLQAQPVTNGSSSSITVKNEREIIGRNFSVPRYLDTTAANLDKGVDSSAALIYTYSTKRFWIREHSPKKWSIIGGTFTSNIVLNGGIGNRLGYWVDGETIPVKGLTLDEAFKVITQRAVAPTYVAPTATVSGSPGSGSYEIGSNLGTITLTAGGNANNSGGFTGNTFYQNGSPLGGNTTTISNLTSTQTFYVVRTYSQGACINNNLGVLDCTGRINASSVNSGNISYTTFAKRYWGFTETLTGVTPTDAEIRAYSQDNTGTSISKSFSIAAPGVESYLVYAFPTSAGSISSITVNGIPSIDAFTITTRNFTNAQGYSQSYRIVVSNNRFSTTSGTTSIVFN